jgi:uncharacterized protein with von Willebrand factor type A (vWA) domain
MNNTFNRFVAFGAITDEMSRQQLAETIFGHLKNNSVNEMGISSTDTDNFADAINSILSNKTMRELCTKDASLAEQITLETLDFINKTKRQMQKIESPFEKEANLLHEFEQMEKDNFEEVWGNNALEITSIYTPQELDIDFYHKEFLKTFESPDKKNKDRISFESVKEHFGEKWGRLLLQKQIRHEMDFIEEARKNFCEELYKRIEELKKLQDLLAPFTGELGRLWDMSKGQWHKVNFDILKKYAELLQRDKSLQELAEMLGRMHSAEKEFEEELFADIRLKPEWKAEHALKADLIGIHESDDISSMLPSEAVFLSDPTSELLFYKKFAEKKLQTFEYQAKTLSYREEEFQNRREKSKEDAKGPFIICVDTSGSMHGTPETVAKTLCFALLKIAVRDNRKCYLISFSTGIETLNLSDIKNSLDKLIAFLSMSFNGGTDAMPALQEALRMLDTEDYKKADVIMISDFIMPGIDEKIQNKINAAKENKTKFHSLVIGNSGNKNTLECFDSNWVYNTDDKSSILQLVKDINTF